MQKIPTLFERDWNDPKRRVTPIVNPACQWVANGEGWPYRKIDGTSCLIRDNGLYKRRELKPGDVAPVDFEFVEADGETGKHIGWVPVGRGAEDRWHREAFSAQGTWADGTYELVGPKIQGNPEHYIAHELVGHKSLAFPADVPRDFEFLRRWLDGCGLEGIVWWHPDGRKAKIKCRDFGLPRYEGITP